MTWSLLPSDEGPVVLPKMVKELVLGSKKKVPYGLGRHRNSQRVLTEVTRFPGRGMGTSVIIQESVAPAMAIKN